jgi:ABC-type transporter MlaC component
VVTQGISLLATQREEMQSVIRRSGGTLRGLVETLRAEQR